MTPYLFCDKIRGEKNFAAHGINFPRNQALLPTHLPKISANEISLVNLFFRGWDMCDFGLRANLFVRQVFGMFWRECF